MIKSAQLLKRLLRLPAKQNFFLFGARNTGKSTLIKQNFSSKTSLFIDFLDPEMEDRFARHPQELKEIVMALSPDITHVILDEIQKVPKLLDVVHSLIEKPSGKFFVMTGSSARKIKHGGANLLAGRAFVYHLYPFSFLELREKFILHNALRWGLLPRVALAKTQDEKKRFLQAYAYTYLKEEVWGEQFIKQLDSFRHFLEVAAQSNGKIVNYANIARDVAVDDKTVKSYFSILEDTLIGFFLEPFQHSFRKRLSMKPKFYFFDLGIVRALTRSLSIPLQAGTSYYGDLFESFIILECYKLASYFKSEYRFSYLYTKDGAEIDLVVERPGKPLLFLEIKSSRNVTKEQLSTFSALTNDFIQSEKDKGSTRKVCESVCFSNDPIKKKIGHITIFPWQEGVRHFFVPNKV